MSASVTELDRAEQNVRLASTAVDAARDDLNRAYKMADQEASEFKQLKKASERAEFDARDRIKAVEQEGYELVGQAGRAEKAAEVDEDEARERLKAAQRADDRAGVRLAEDELEAAKERLRGARRGTEDAKQWAREARADAQRAADEAKENCAQLDAAFEERHSGESFMTLALNAFEPMGMMTGLWDDLGTHVLVAEGMQEFDRAEENLKQATRERERCQRPSGDESRSQSPVTQLAPVVSQRVPPNQPMPTDRQSKLPASYRPSDRAAADAIEEENSRRQAREDEWEQLKKKVADGIQIVKDHRAEPAFVKAGRRADEAERRARVRSDRRPARTKISFLAGGAKPVTPPQPLTAAWAVDRLKDVGHKTTTTYMPKSPDLPESPRPESRVSAETRKAANERFEELMKRSSSRKSFFGRKK